MLFEGNPTTWPHQDTYYLDSERIGGMTAAWIAVEDIKPGAGKARIYEPPDGEALDASPESDLALVARPSLPVFVQWSLRGSG